MKKGFLAGLLSGVIAVFVMYQCPAAWLGDGSIQRTESAVSRHQGERALVAYFTYGENIETTSLIGVDAIASASLHGESSHTIDNTSLMAEKIQQAAKADRYAIVVKQPYAPQYEIMRNRAYEEIRQHVLPELASPVPDMAPYDVIYLGTPIWAGSLPPAVASFLSQCNMAGKRIVLFGAHRGSGFGSLRSQVQALCPDAVVQEGLMVRADAENSDAARLVSQWLGQET